MKYLFSIVFVFYYISAYAQEVTVIDSSTNQPVKRVVVSSSKSSASAITNANGVFSLNAFSLGDTLTFQHVAYNKKSISYDFALSKKIISLSLRIIKQEEVNITSRRQDKNSSSFKEELEVKTADKMSYMSVGDYLKNQSSLFIKDYGGYGGQKSVSSRGMSSENTTVLFNEARVNDLRTGMFDFNLIDINSVDRIDYLKSFDFDTPFSSPGGVVKLYTDSFEEKPHLNFHAKFDSDLLKSFGLNYSDGCGGYSYRVTAERTYSPNHYDYNFENKDYERENAWFSKTFFSGDFIRDIDNLKIKFYSNYSYLNSGIPGFVATNNTNSSRESDKTVSSLNILNAEYLVNENCSITSNVNYNYQYLKIDDPDGELYYNNDNKGSNLHDVSLSVKFNYHNDEWKFNSGYEFDVSNLYNLTGFLSGPGYVNNINRHANRFSAGLQRQFYTPVSFINNIVLTGLIANEQLIERLPKKADAHSTSYKLGAAVYPQFINGLSLKTNFGNDYRLPTFNERYYSMLYNHYDLNSEKYQWLDAGFDYYFNLFGQTQFSASYFDIKGKNKIIWVPTRMAIQIPKNIANFESHGFELSLTKHTPDSVFCFTASYNYTDARSKTKTSEQDLSYDKFIMYTPLHRLNIGLSADLSIFHFSVSTSYVSQTFYSTDNYYKLPDYMLLDASAGVKFKILGRKSVLSLTAYNLTKENYFVIQSYPMPLTTYLLTYYLEVL